MVFARFKFEVRLLGGNKFVKKEAGSPDFIIKTK